MLPAEAKQGLRSLGLVILKATGGLLGDVRKKKEKVDWGSPEEASRA